MSQPRTTDVTGETPSANPFSAHTLSDYLLMIRDRWLIGLILGGLAAGIFAYMRLQEIPEYRATATVIVEFTGDRVVNIEEVVDTDVSSEVELINHQAQLNSNSFLARVISRIPESRKADIIEPYKTKENPDPSLWGILAGGRNIGRQGNSFIFYISFQHRDPEVCKYIANLFTEEYIESLLDRSDTGTASAIKFLEARAEFVGIDRAVQFA